MVEKIVVEIYKMELCREIGEAGFMRKYYLDNLRSFTILLLFPVHTFMIWNDFGLKFYVWGGDNRIISTLIVLINPWFMPLLFVIAGVSAGYSLEKRSIKEFCMERVNKLFVPFVAGTVLLVPIQTFYARKFFFGYEGGILENLKYFFTHVTDFTGYDGGFTPGQLWFILFLFVISLVSLIFMKWLPVERCEAFISQMPLWALIGLFVPVWLFYYLGNIGGFSLGKNLVLYLLGYYVLADDSVMERLRKHIKRIGAVWGISELLLAAAYYRYVFYGDPAVNVVCWLGILTLFVLGKEYLNKETAFTKYFRKASFPDYVIHQSVLVALGYYVLKGVDNLLLQVIVIICSSFVITVLCYEIVRRIPVLRKLVGA